MNETKTWIGIDRELDVKSLYPTTVWFDDAITVDTSETVINSHILTQRERRILNMENKVLELYYTKKRNEIIKEFDEKEKEFISNNPMATKYRELVEKFESDMKALYESEDNESAYITDKHTASIYKYGINYNKLNDEFREQYVSERDEKLNELSEFREEVYALLSLSSDLEYQLDILVSYKIIDKKTKKIVD